MNCHTMQTPDGCTDPVVAHVEAADHLPSRHERIGQIAVLAFLHGCSDELIDGSRSENFRAYDVVGLVILKWEKSMDSLLRRRRLESKFVVLARLRRRQVSAGQYGPLCRRAKFVDSRAKREMSFVPLM